jgi:hypothetical protein
MKGVDSLYFAEGPQSIGFLCCWDSGVRYVHLPSTLTKIIGCAFDGCGNLEEINIPEGVTALGSDGYWGGHCFSECSKLKNVVLPKTLKYMGIATFNKCTSLDTITIPEPMTNINEHCFYGCTGLTKVNMDRSNVSSISYRAFEGCSKLQEISIPETLWYIGDYAFMGTRSLHSLVFPSKLSYIGKQAFYNSLAYSNDSVFIKTSNKNVFGTIFKRFLLKSTSTATLYRAYDKNFDGQMIIIRPVSQYAPSASQPEEPTYSNSYTVTCLKSASNYESMAKNYNAQCDTVYSSWANDHTTKYEQHCYKTEDNDSLTVWTFVSETYVSNNVGYIVRDHVIEGSIEGTAMLRIHLYDVIDEWNKTLEDVTYNKIVGMMSSQHIQDVTGKYGLKDNMFYQLDSSGTFPAEHAYLQLDESANAKSVSIMIDDWDFKSRQRMYLCPTCGAALSRIDLPLTTPVT